LPGTGKDKTFQTVSTYNTKQKQQLGFISQVNPSSNGIGRLLDSGFTTSLAKYFG
jgi:hypothetical protein